MKRLIWEIIVAIGIFLLFMAICAPRCIGADLRFEISDFTGWGSHSGTDYWQNSWSIKGEKYVHKERLYLGGKLDYTRYPFGHRGGLSALVGLDFYAISYYTFYSEFYGGLAVKSGASHLNKQHNNLIGPGLCGQFGAEIGVRMPVSKTSKAQFVVGIGYDHMSSMRSGDKGLNTFGPKLGIRW